METPVVHKDAPTGSVWAVVPAKDLGQAKSRLAPLLSAGQREGLMLGLLRGTMAALAGAPSLAGWLVVSRDARLLDLGSRFGALAVREEGDDLNAALRQAQQVAVAHEAAALLVVPGDLPLVTAAAVEALLAARPLVGPSALLAPARDGRGTNALLLSPPGALEFAFGEDSAPRHRAAARAAGLPMALHEAAEFALDLDTPADLEAVARLQGQWMQWAEDATPPRRPGLWSLAGLAG